MNRPTDPQRLARAKAIAQALRLWIDNQPEPRMFPDRTALSRRLGIDSTPWGRISSGNMLLGPKFNNFYARLFMATGIEDSDPRTLPAMGNTRQAWTQSEFDKWLAREGTNYLLSFHAPISTPEAPSPATSDDQPTPQPQPQAKASSATTPGGVLDRILNAGARYIGRSIAAGIQETMLASPETGWVTPQALGIALKHYFDAMTPKLVEQLVAAMPSIRQTDAITEETIKTIVSDQLGSVLELLEEIRQEAGRRNGGSVIARGSQNLVLQLLREMENLTQPSATKVDRDAYVARHRDELGNLFQKLQLMTLSAADRERNLPTANMGVNLQ